MLRVALAVFVVCSAASTQLPEFGAFANDAGMTSGAMALLLQGYTAALLLGLLGLGGVSDTLGRRPVVVASVLCALLATAGVAVVPNVVALGIARWFQGAAVALVMGAATAWLAALGSPERAARQVGFASTVGFGAGPLSTTLGIELTGGSATEAYAVQSVILALSAALLFTVPDREPRSREPTRLRWPEWPRGSGIPGAAILLGWSVAGVIVAVLPGWFTDIDAAWAGGVAVFTMLAGGVVGQVHARRQSGARSLQLGAVTLTLGTAAMAGLWWMGSPVGVLVAATLLGTATHGYLYVGGLLHLSTQAPTTPRVTSGYFALAYVGFGAPAVAIGLLSAPLGTTGALSVLAVAVAVASVALVLTLRRSLTV